MPQVRGKRGFRQTPLISCKVCEYIEPLRLCTQPKHESLGQTHSFDDQGRETDANNRLRNWWTTADAEQFKGRADRLSTQYSAIEPLPGLHIKGDVTLGENIADLGGVTIALEAYHTSLHGQAAPVLDGFTGDQRFFLG